MSVTVNMKKIVIGIVVLLIIGIVFWWNSTEEQRAESKLIKQYIKLAQKQALEIAIIEQSSKLADYRQQLAANKQQPVAQPIAPNPPMPGPCMPAIEDFNE